MKKLLATLVIYLTLMSTAFAQLNLPYTSFTPGQIISSAQFTANFTSISNNALNRTGGTMTGTLTLRDLVPSTHATYDIGTNSVRFRDAFLSRNATVGGTLNVTGDTTLSTAIITTLTCTGCIGATQLASTSVGASSYGSAASVGTFTVDADGRLTAASSVSIQIAETQITDGSVLARLAANETISGQWVFTGGTFTLSNALPLLVLNQTDGAANGKIWAFVTDGTAFNLTAYNDGFAGGTNAIIINRSGSTVTSIQLAASSITLTGPTTIGAITGTTASFSGAISAASYGAVSGTTGTFSAGVSGTTGSFTSQILAYQGSASVVSFGFQGDNNTGLHWVSSDLFSLTTGGASRYLVGSTAFVPAAANTYLLGNMTNYWAAVHSTVFASGTGAANATAYQVGETTTGMYSPGTGQLAFSAGGTTTTDYMIFLDTNDGSGGSNKIYLGAETQTSTLYPGSDNVHALGAGGNRWTAVWAANGVIQTSDERTKRDVEDITGALGVVKQIRTIQFRWIDGADTTRLRYGVSAQQLISIGLGNIVYGDPEDDEELLGVNYGELVPLLIQSIKELEARVAELENVRR